jgi:hypothetical protein
MARFLAGSRYTNGLVSVNRNNQQFLVPRETLVMPPADDDQFITITNEMINRPDVLSYVAYQRGDLWWAIFDVNNVKNPMTIQINQRMRIPDLSKLLAAISTLNMDL